MIVAYQQNKKKKEKETFLSVCFCKLFNPDYAFLTKIHVGFFPQVSDQR